MRPIKQISIKAYICNKATITTVLISFVFGVIVTLFGMLICFDHMKIAKVSYMLKAYYIKKYIYREKPDFILKDREILYIDPPSGYLGSYTSYDSNANLSYFMHFCNKNIPNTHPVYAPKTGLSFIDQGILESFSYVHEEISTMLIFDYDNGNRMQSLIVSLFSSDKPKEIKIEFGKDNSINIIDDN